MFVRSLVCSRVCMFTCFCLFVCVIFCMFVCCLFVYLDILTLAPVIDDKRWEFHSTAPTKRDAIFLDKFIRMSLVGDVYMCWINNNKNS